MRLRRIEPDLRRALRGPCALPRGSRLLVALSGGADSTALLLGLRSLAREFGLELCAAHLDHGLRGADARADAAFCAALCERLGVPFEGRAIDARARLARRGLSGEQGLRVLRRAFLLAAARRAGAAAIATAHTADDQLETLLLRLARGTGVPGLGGIRPRAGRFLHPLLEAPRAAIEADLTSAGQSWREDASNRDLTFARNRVRHEVVPALLAAVGATPSARSRLARHAAALARESAETSHWANSHVAPLLRRLSRIQAHEMTLDSRCWATYPPAIRRTLLRALWGRWAPTAGRLTRRHLEALDRLASSDRGGAEVSLPGGRMAGRDREVVRFRPSSHADVVQEARAIPRRTAWSAGPVRGGWTSGVSARRRAGADSPREEFFAAEGLAGRLRLRPGRADEWFTPFGRTRPVRLGEFLHRQPVSRDLRSRPTVLADDGGILWVVGVRRGARAPLTPATRRALRVHVEAKA